MPPNVKPDQTGTGPGDGWYRISAPPKTRISNAFAGDLPHWRWLQHGLAALALAGLLSGLLSLSMETLQGYLPQRVPSNLDLALNTAGGLSGAAVVLLLGRLGVLAWLRR